MLRTIIAVSAAAAALAPAAYGQSRDSVYSELQDCPDIDAQGMAPIMVRCEAVGEWTVTVGASDRTSRAAFGSRGVEAQLSEGPLTQGLAANVQRTVEWRGIRDGNWFAPYATILRWRSLTPRAEDGSVGSFEDEWVRDEEFLVVSALRPEGPVGAGHAAYIDVTQVENANAVARAVADRASTSFVCGEDQVMRIGAQEAAAYR